MSCRGISTTEFRQILRDELREVAVPKPSRAAELYAALTLSIVLLKEQAAGDNVPTQRRHAVGHEIEELLKKRADLEEDLEKVGGA
jgi:homoserine kinase